MWVWWRPSTASSQAVYFSGLFAIPLTPPRAATCPAPLALTESKGCKPSTLHFPFVSECARAGLLIRGFTRTKFVRTEPLYYRLAKEQPGSCLNEMVVFTTEKVVIIVVVTLIVIALAYIFRFGGFSRRRKTGVGSDRSQQSPTGSN